MMWNHIEDMWLYSMADVEAPTMQFLMSQTLALDFLDMHLKDTLTM